MDCIDSVYHCLCAYLLDEKSDQETLRIILSDPDLCPRCSKCADADRSMQIESQRYMRSFIRNRYPRIAAPVSLRNRILSELDKA